MRGSIAAYGLALAAMVSPAAHAVSLRAPGYKRPEQEASVEAQNGLSDATILIVRHAEKPADGSGLSEAGQVRAQVYAGYFERFQMDGAPMRIDALVAAEDTKKSSRPRLTLEPLSLETGMMISQPCSERAASALAAWLRQRPPHQTTLVSWHHTQIGKVLAALGADPAAFLPNGQWPDDAFDWIIALRFDHEGHLIPGASRVIHEPEDVDDVVWSAMDHPTITPIADTEATTTLADN